MVAQIDLKRKCSQKQNNDSGKAGQEEGNWDL